jgi:pimeloyl-ACP methyl ester carboxylesterase
LAAARARATLRRCDDARGTIDRRLADVDHVDVDGTTIAHRRVGTGRPLVLLHGAPADGRVWTWMTPNLAVDFTVIAWDAPGFGQSAAIPDRWQAADYADALAGFLAALDVERPIIAGHSFGSILALATVERHPTIASGLVLISAYAGWAGSLPADVVAARLQSFLAMADLGDVYDPTAYPGLFSDLIPADRSAALFAMMRENIRRPTVRTAGHLAAETDLRAMLPSIDIPTLVLHGEVDARSPLSAARSMHAAIPGSELVILPRLGHACIFEDPDACCEAIRRFAERVPRTP